MHEKDGGGRFSMTGDNCMSKFSEYLRELLHSQGESIAGIAKNAGLERTSIHKALKDERILSYTALKKLIRYLQLTLPEVRELTCYYEMLLQGEDLYKIQEAICEILTDLIQLHLTGGLYVSGEIPSVRPSDFPELILGRAQVENAVREIWQYETALSGCQLEIFLPSGCVLTEFLLRLWRNGRDFSVKQLVNFVPSRFGAAENLRLVQKLLPLAFVSESRYFAYYYFENAAVQASVSPMSYFIVTPHFLITLDEKLSAAQVQTSPELLRLYRKRFFKVAEECQPLCSYEGDPLQILEAYMENTDQGAYYTMMLQPCLGRYYTRERIAGQFREEIPEREKLIECSDRRFGILRELTGDYYTIFSEKGLRQFVSDGVEIDLPSELVKPFPPELRLELLRQFREDIAQDKIHGCMVDPEEIPIPPYLTFTCDPRHGVHFYAVQGFSGGAFGCNLHIRDGGIGQSFCKFIKSLPGSRYVYEKERTLQILDGLIRDLQEGSGEG